MVTSATSRYTSILRLLVQERNAVRGELAQLMRDMNALDRERQTIEAARLAALRASQLNDKSHSSITALQSADDYQQGLQLSAEKLSASHQYLTKQLGPLQLSLSQADQRVAAIEKLIEREQKRRVQQSIACELAAQDTAAMVKFHRENQRQHG